MSDDLHRILRHRTDSPTFHHVRQRATPAYSRRHVPEHPHAPQLRARGDERRSARRRAAVRAQDRRDDEAVGVLQVHVAVGPDVHRGVPLVPVGVEPAQLLVQGGAGAGAAAREAHDVGDAAVQCHQALGAHPLVQAVDVLGDEEIGCDAGQRVVPLVGVGAAQEQLDALERKLPPLFRRRCTY